MNKPKQRTGMQRTSFTIGATVTEAENQRLEQRRHERGCTRAALVRQALDLDPTIESHPLLAAAGALVQASHAFAGALERNELYYAATTLRRLESLARTMIQLETERRLRR